MAKNIEAMTFDEAKGRLFDVLSQHLGKENAVGMDVLHEKIFGEKVLHKINDTKNTRILITALRNQGRAIGSNSSKNGGGYYLPRAGSELDDYCKRIHRQALRKLAMEARIRNISMPELVGQMSINFDPPSHEAMEDRGEEDGEEKDRSQPPSPGGYGGPG